VSTCKLQYGCKVLYLLTFAISWWNCHEDSFGWNCGDINLATAQLGEHFLSVLSDCLCIALRFTLNNIISLPPLSFLQSTLVSSFRVVVNLGCNLVSKHTHSSWHKLSENWLLMLTALLHLHWGNFTQFCETALKLSLLWLTWSAAHNMAIWLFSCSYLPDFSGLNCQFISDSEVLKYTMNLKWLI